MLQHNPVYLLLPTELYILFTEISIALWSWIPKINLSMKMRVFVSCFGCWTQKQNKTKCIDINALMAYDVHTAVLCQNLHTI